MSRRKRSLEERLTERENRRRSADSVQPAPKRRRRRWSYLLLFLLIFFLLLPNLVGWLGLQNRLVRFAVPDFQGNLTIQKVSLGWFQKIRLEQISASDAQGQMLFEVESLESSQALYQFLTSKEYGTFFINRPSCNVVLRDDGSNFEDVLANYLVSQNANEASRQSSGLNWR
ncbi:MAG: hypothetical protein AAF939_17505, partial [Planctomycetota bacterium]